MIDTNQLWDGVLAEMELSLSKANFSTWFRNTCIAKQEDSTIYVSVPNTFVRDWLINKYHKNILHILRNLDEGIRSIEYLISKIETREDKPKDLSFGKQITTANLGLNELYINKESNLNPKYTLDSFVVGSFNEVAYAAALAVMKEPGTKYNPLFIYGGTGLGKTHLIQAIGNHILQSRPLKNDVLERNLLLINDLPGVTVKAVLEPSKVPGAADLNLVAEAAPVNASFSYDNYNTRYTGPHETTTMVALNSSLRPGDQTQVNFTRASVFKQLYAIDLFNETPIGSNGARLKLDASLIETDSGFTLKPFDVIGRTKIISAFLREPIIRSRNTNFGLLQGFNYLDSESSILGTPSYTDHVRTFKVGAFFNNTDRWRGSNSFSVNLTQGLPLFGSTPGGAIFVSRQGASSNFTKMTFQATRLQGLTRRFSLLGVFTSQYSLNPLLTAEQFGFGGSGLGRGYNNSEIIGDSGVGASLELHLDTYPGFRFLQMAQFYVFYDIGKVWSQAIPAVEVTSFSASAASAGFGAQLIFNTHLSANTFIAEPLTRKLSTAVAINQNPSAPHIFFGITASV